MDEDAVLLALGNLQGEMRGYNTRMDGLGREIGEIKEVLKCKSEDCNTCRKAIDEEISDQTARIADIESQHTNEKAVVSFIDSTTGRIALVTGAVSGVIALAVLAMQVIGRIS